MRGRLLSLLRAARGGRNSLPAIKPTRPPVMPLSPKRLLTYAHDIACGMEYIASKNVSNCFNFLKRIPKIHLYSLTLDCPLRSRSSKYST